MSRPSNASDAAEESRLKRGEFKLKCIETGSKIVGALVVVGTLLLGCGNYISNRTNELKQREQQFKLQLYEQQIKLYQEWVGVASLIAFAEDHGSPEVDRLSREFNELFWGDLAVLKDDTIVRAGDNFNTQLANLRNGKATTEDLLRSLHHLGQACRKSLCCSVGLELASHTDAGGEPYKCGQFEVWEEKIGRVAVDSSASQPPEKGEIEAPLPPLKEPIP